jgi:hypothetical protein
MMFNWMYPNEISRNIVQVNYASLLNSVGLSITQFNKAFLTKRGKISVIRRLLVSLLSSFYLPFVTLTTWHPLSAKVGTDLEVARLV